MERANRYRDQPVVITRIPGPVDYDEEGLFDELLVEISETADQPSPFPVGRPAEASVFNLFILDSEGPVMWFHQCAYVSRSSLGTTLSSARHIGEEAQSIYEINPQDHGFRHGAGRWMRSYYGWMLMVTRVYSLSAGA